MITVYQQLCPVIFGRGAIKQLGEKIKEMHAGRVFCICDGGIEKTGVIQQVQQILQEAGADSLVYNKVSPDAPFEMVEKAGEAARKYAADMVLGIGGGSSLDTAKAVAVLCDNLPPLSQYYEAYRKSEISKETPLILIPTLSGTGSEVTNISVIHDKVSGAKETVIRSADLAIIDPELTVTAPPKITASAALDAMLHAVEAYTSAGHSPYSDLQALKAIQLIYENLVPAFTDGTDMEARANLAFASNIAGMSFQNASVHVGHAAAHEIGLQFHMPHGEACALVLPEVLVYMAEIVPERARRIAEVLGMKHVEACTIAEIRKYILEQVQELLRAVKIESFRARGITLAQLKNCAGAAVEKNAFIKMAPVTVSVSVMEKLLEEMYSLYE